MSVGTHCEYSCFHQPLFRTATLGGVEWSRVIVATKLS